MGKYRLALLGALAVSLSGTHVFATPPSDEDISKKIVGSWKAAPDSPDYIPQKKYGVESYAPDGAETYVVYSDASCKRIVAQVAVKWTVHPGILTTILSNGRTLRDEVVAREELPSP